MKKNDWFIHYLPPKPIPDELVIHCLDGTVRFHATSRTDALRQYHEAVRAGGIPRRCRILGIGVIDENDVMRRWLVIHGRMVAA